MRLSEKDAAALLGTKGYRRRHKFNAKRVEVDGIWFDSQKEAARYGELQMLVKAGAIIGLILQPEFSLVVRDVLICKYRADFRYTDLTRGGEIIVEDVKGFLAPTYRLKRKLMRAIFSIEIVEV